MKVDKMQKLILLLLVFEGSVLLADPLVIAHRGASGYLPEHTLEAYRLAISQGADYIEPDLVITGDGHLIARHEHYLEATTDVAQHPEFADRKRTIGNRSDWFTEDFSLKEIKTLRARQAFAGRSAEHDGKYAIPTLQEVINLARNSKRPNGGAIGIYPETKVPGHFRSLGYDFAGLLLTVLRDNQLDSNQAPVFIQSFEPEILMELNELTDIQLVQLVNPARGTDGKMIPGKPNIPLTSIAQYADGVGALKWLLIDQKGQDSGFVDRAEKQQLFVHAWTFRDDAVNKSLFDTIEQEISFFLKLGISGFFTDFPDTGVKVVNQRARGSSDQQ